MEKINCKKKFALAVHGGTNCCSRSDICKKIEKVYKIGLKDALKAGYKILKEGGTHLNAVQASLVSMENNPIFNSGKGAKLNQKHKCELDASIMDGSNLNCGAVAGVQRIKNPIIAARKVMEDAKHILLIGEYADEFAKNEGLAMVENDYFITDLREEEFDYMKEMKAEADTHGTCGAIALDQKGNLGAGTSTGGTTYKMAGRVGDSPIIGAGNYADNAYCAISCSGKGEIMMKHCIAYDLRARMKYEIS